MKHIFEGLVCIGVFAAGVIWSKLIFPSDFWKVENIHDLFEIFGAIATSITVYIALTWKRQLGSTRDYEHARKAAVAVLKYKESLISVWEAANSCLQQNSGEDLDDRMRDAVIMTTENRLSVAEKLRSELVELVVECRAIWRNGIDKDLSRALAFEASCANCANMYLIAIRPLTNPVSKIVARHTLDKFRQWMIDKNLTSRELAEEYVDKLLAPVDDKLDAKMR